MDGKLILPYLSGILIGFLLKAINMHSSMALLFTRDGITKGLFSPAFLIELVVFALAFSGINHYAKRYVSAKIFQIASFVLGILTAMFLITAASVPIFTTLG